MRSLDEDLNAMGLTRETAMGGRVDGGGQLGERAFVKVKGEVVNGKAKKVRQHRETSAERADDRRRNRKRKSYLRKYMRSARVRKRLMKHARKLDKLFHRARKAIGGSLHRMASAIAGTRRRVKAPGAALGASASPQSNMMEMTAMVGGFDINRDGSTAFANLSLIEAALGGHFRNLADEWSNGHGFLTFLDEAADIVEGASDDAATIARGLKAANESKEAVDSAELTESLLAHVALATALAEASEELEGLAVEALADLDDPQTVLEAAEAAEEEILSEGGDEDEEDDDEEEDEDDDEEDEDDDEEDEDDEEGE